MSYLNVSGEAQPVWTDFIYVTVSSISGPAVGSDIHVVCFQIEDRRWAWYLSMMAMITPITATNPKVRLILSPLLRFVLMGAIVDDCETKLVESFLLMLLVSLVL